MHMVDHVGKRLGKQMDMQYSTGHTAVTRLM